MSKIEFSIFGDIFYGFSVEFFIDFVDFGRWYPLGQGLTRLPNFQDIVLEDYWELESNLGT